MKEATEFGIKYLRTLPDGSQKFIMHQNIWTKREEAEQMVENLKGVVGCPLLVEIWDPIDVQILNEAADKPSVCPSDCPGNRKAEEPLPEPEEKKAEEPKPAKQPVNIRSVSITHKPDGTVDIKEDGKEVTDPEQKKKILGEDFFKGLEKILTEWPFFRDPLDKVGPGSLGDPRMFLWDPSQAPVYSTGGWPNPSSVSHRPRFQSEAGNPAFKCEAGD